MSEPIKHDLDDSIAQASAIILWRIYDVLIGIYSNINPEEAARMVELHKDGFVISPPPAYRAERDNDE